jgi:hypothetical protein
MADKTKLKHHSTEPGFLARWLSQPFTFGVKSSVRDCIGALQRIPNLPQFSGYQVVIDETLYFEIADKEAPEAKPFLRGQIATDNNLNILVISGRIFATTIRAGFSWSILLICGLCLLFSIAYYPGEDNSAIIISFPIIALLFLSIIIGWQLLSRNYLLHSFKEYLQAG